MPKAMESRDDKDNSFLVENRKQENNDNKILDDFVAIASIAIVITLQFSCFSY